MNNGGDNPPGYNPDIINNQLITTFGTTTAPDNFAFGSVNVRPTPQQHLEHTFNTTDLTQEAIELAIDDAPGLDVHTVGINQEQIVGDGAPINESALTIINWGKYRLRTLGLHQIATADNSNNWVVPALMEVSIPLIQNQVIDHTGTYHIVQRTVNGQTGLVIEEYIPEPEPEPQNNARFMIIDEENNEENNNNNNNNNEEMVLRRQNNVRGLPDSNGEAIIGNFDINIPPPTITSPIQNNGYYKFNGNNLISGTNQDYNLNVNVQNKFYITSIIFGINNENIASSNTNWTYYTDYTHTTFSTGTEVITIYKNTTNNNYTIKLYHNIDNSIYIYDKTWVFTKNVDTYYSSLRFIDENNNFLFSMLDDNSSETSASYNNDSNQSVLNSNIFSFDKISWMTFN